MANRWTPGKDWTMISSVRGLISCCFQSSRSASPPPDDHKKHYGSNSQSFIDDKQRVTVDPPSTHSVISCSSRGSGRKRSNRNSGLDGGDSGVISEGAEAGSPQRPRSRSARHSQGSAYSYDDADTSSDSDDDVLRRYQQSMQRSQSVHSYSQSQKSQASSKKGQMTAVSERNTDADVEEGDVTSKKALLSGPESRPSVTPLWAEREEEGKVEDAMEGIIDTDTHKEEAVTYENQGFEEEKEHASPGEGSQGSTGGHSAREHTGSAGDTASGSAPDPPHDEHLFDVSDLQEREPVLISKCGSIEATFSYDPARSRMNVTVHQARDIPTKDRGGANSTQVRLLLLPSKKVRQKTKIKTGDNPEFQETLSFKVPLKEASNMGIRFRLYGCERMRRERMIGECVIGFASFSLDSDVTLWLTLEPRSNLSGGDSKLDLASLTRSDSASSTQSMQHGGMPELLIGLAYNGTTGRLSVEVIKGSNFRNMAMNRAPDTYVKLTLMSPNGQEIAHSKTSIRRGQPNPLYKETFMYQVALFQLPDVTLMVSVYNKRNMKRKEMIGWFSLGYNNSGEEELSHWDDMRENKGDQVCRWHVLLEA